MNKREITYLHNNHNLFKIKKNKRAIEVIDSSPNILDYVQIISNRMEQGTLFLRKLTFTNCSLQRKSSQLNIDY